MDRLIKPEINLKLPQRPEVSKGQGAWPFLLDHVENWAWRKDIFTPNELDAIINIGNSYELEKASIHGKQSDAIRNSFVNFLFPNEYTNWIFARIAEAIWQMNSDFFKFDITGLEQGLQFTRYEAPGQHYEWHIDKSFNTPSRKLSLSLQLSDPSEYEGGQLELQFHGTPIEVDRSRGFAAFFPSYVLHRVTPVTKGTRYSLVCWVAGPPFR